MSVPVELMNWQQKFNPKYLVDFYQEAFAQQKLPPPLYCVNEQSSTW